MIENKIMKEPKHYWTYEENELCVEEIFKNFVIDGKYDYETVITKLYNHFNGRIKKSSIKMKLQNIKYLLNQYNIPNTLTIAALQNVSKVNVAAFFAVAKKYIKLF